MITVENLTYEYPGIRALDRVSFTIEANTVTALVGPNGAGKTTLMRCLAALDSPLSGRITLDGLDVAEHPRQVHARVGFLYDFYGLYEDLTVTQCLRYRAAAQGAPAGRHKEMIEKAAERLSLTGRMDQKAGTLSRGWRQKLAIALNIVHEPKVILLDEPASGLDPEARHDLSGVIRDLHGEGATIMVSSHILSELEDYSTHMLAIRHGKLESHGPLAGVASDKVRITVTLSGPLGALKTIAEAEGAEVLQSGKGEAVLSMSADQKAQQKLLKALAEADVPVCGFAVGRSGLKDSYLASRSGDVS